MKVFGHLRMPLQNQIDSGEMESRQVLRAIKAESNVFPNVPLFLAVPEAKMCNYTVVKMCTLRSLIEGYTRLFIFQKY